ncbi:MAG: Uncharacterized protein LiPW16_363 [Microgenomates group bacterium LiPW_16]|nr:MAG: Uncharacterized protein LiPW16_363 [Microgenomates group bacterium LiPW_16]
MRKILPLIFFLFLPLLFITSLPIFADFEQAYQDYLYQYDNYRTSFTNFLTAKNRYLTYKTLVSETQALSATKIFLEARDQVSTTYLQMLLERNPQESFRKLLEEEISFFSDHKAKIPAVGSLEDVIHLSEIVEEHFARTEVLTRQVVANFLLTKVKTLEERLASLEAGFEEKVNLVKGQGKDVTTLERWLLSTRNKRLLARDKLEEASYLTNKLTPKKSTQVSEEFGKIQVLIFEANQYLKEGAAYLREIKEELKYGNY